MDRMVVETLAIAPQAYLPKFGEQFNLFSCVYTQAGSLTIAKWSKFGVYTYPLIILRPGKLLLPALQSEMERTYNLFTIKARESTGPLAWSLVFLWFYCTCLAWKLSLSTQQGFALQEHTPALAGGVNPV